jgi:NADH/NAD ratio-sensing transcriptional regulator Rex
LYVFKALNDLSPVYLKELIKPYKPVRSLRSESAFLLQVPSTRTKTYGESRFDKAVASLWNSLPVHLRVAKSIDIFKVGLKTYLYRQAFYV